MDQEERAVLLKDLTARLSYGVKVHYKGVLGERSEPMLITDYNGVTVNSHYEVEGIKAYLRPMSSMTKEELKELIGFTSLSMHRFICDATNTDHWYHKYEEEDWLLEHHFDFRNLIRRGLAIEAPEGMYK